MEVLIWPQPLFGPRSTLHYMATLSQSGVLNTPTLESSLDALSAQLAAQLERHRTSGLKVEGKPYTLSYV